jgi:alkylated DNA repair protein alkB family protein 5
VINLVDGDDSLNQSVISVESSAVEEVTITKTPPNKLRRSARASTRRYRQSNKVSSSDSESEVVYVKKTQKRKESKERRESTRRRSSRRTRTTTASNDEQSDIEKPTKKIIEKENKNSAKKESKQRNGGDDKKSNTREVIQLNNNNNDLEKSITSSPTDKESELELIKSGITTIPNFFDESMCRKIEKKIDQIAEKAKCGLYRQKTYDRAPLRNKYFFGEGYTYGKFMDDKGPGKEKIYPKGEVDEIPKWIEKHIIKKLYDDKIVEEGFINSAVINEYFAGGCIVSHIDPIHIFDRPIISISFNCKTYLSFGCKFSFNPIRTSEPILSVPLDRGCLFMMKGYAADGVTHCVRPQDIVDRRCVIIFRRVFPDAPRLGDVMSPEHPLQSDRRKYHPRTYSYDSRGGPNNRSNRKRPRYSENNNNNNGDDHNSWKRARHSY